MVICLGCSFGIHLQHSLDDSNIPRNLYLFFWRKGFPVIYLVLKNPPAHRDTFHRESLGLKEGFIPPWVISALRLFQNPCKWSKFLWSKRGYWGSISKLRRFGVHSEQREFGSDWRIGSRPFAWNVMPWPPFRLKKRGWTTGRGAVNKPTWMLATPTK